MVVIGPYAFNRKRDCDSINFPICSASSGRGDAKRFRRIDSMETVLVAPLFFRGRVMPVINREVRAGQLFFGRMLDIWIAHLLKQPAICKLLFAFLLVVYQYSVFPWKISFTTIYSLFDMY